jgi:uncharacterized repeat protein (TIGR03943 family)
MRLSAAKFLNGITLLGLGGVLISFCLKGRIDQYLHPQFRPWVLVGGIAFCVAGTIYLMAKKSMDCCLDGECVHTNRQNPWRAATAFGVIVLPLTAGTYLSKDGYDKQAILNRGFVQDVSTLPSHNSVAPLNGQQIIPPGALGADQDERASAEPPLPQDTTSGTPPKALAKASETPQTGTNADDGSDQYLPRAADGNVALEVTDLLYGENEASLRKEFTGKTIEVVGQYLPGSKSNEFKIVRMLIVCCAADARPIAVPVQAQKTVSVADMSWVKVTGTAEFRESGNGKAKVTVKAAEIEPTDPPQDAMLY